MQDELLRFVVGLSIIQFGQMTQTDVSHSTDWFCSVRHELEMGANGLLVLRMIIDSTVRNYMQFDAPQKIHMWYMGSPLILIMRGNIVDSSEQQ